MGFEDERPAENPVLIELDEVALEGDLIVTPAARSLILFAHGSGSSRQSPRNRYVAGVLREAGLATLLFDLLTVEEEIVDSRTAELRFNIELLAERLIGATDWVLRKSDISQLRVGYFGASTGAAAALIAAARRSATVYAVVSRGGRPDLAQAVLPEVKVPTLLIVGEYDDAVIRLNQEAMVEIPGEKEMAIVPGATHLFEEPGALEEVARLASEWFLKH